jgi:recombinational DNA repair protein RecR
MNDEITIISESTNPNQGDTEKYLVLSNHYRWEKINLKSYCIDELLKIVNELRPEIIMIFTADMHGRAVVSFLEYFLSRKFKPVIYELLSGYRGIAISRITIIKMQKYV